MVRKQTCLGCRKGWDAPSEGKLKSQCPKCVFNNRLAFIFLFIVLVSFILWG